VRTVFEATVGRFGGWPAWDADGLTEQPGPSTAQFIWFDIVADGFLYNMVRTIAGTLIRVGEHKWDAADVRRILERHDRREAGPTAPACGLYLVSVHYEEAPQHAGAAAFPAAAQDEARS
jgi:tRNA pseudouridine38-40 synthase